MNENIWVIREFVCFTLSDNYKRIELEHSYRIPLEMGYD